MINYWTSKALIGKKAKIIKCIFNPSYVGKIGVIISVKISKTHNSWYHNGIIFKIDFINDFYYDEFKIN